jgi:hypothetical protein
VKYITTYLLAATLLIGELHTFWGKGVISVEQNGKKVLLRDGLPVPKENWILFRSVPMTMQKNVKEAGSELIFILYFIAAWFFAKYPNRVNKTTVLTFICFMVMDAAMYFVNFKTWHYGYIYFVIALIWLYLYHRLKPLKPYSR